MCLILTWLHTNVSFQSNSTGKTLCKTVLFQVIFIETPCTKICMVYIDIEKVIPDKLFPLSRVTAAILFFHHFPPFFSQYEKEQIRQVVNLTNVCKKYQNCRIIYGHIWNHHDKCIQQRTNMPGIDSLICEIDINISETWESKDIFAQKNQCPRGKGVNRCFNAPDVPGVTFRTLPIYPKLVPMVEKQEAWRLATAISFLSVTG